MVNKIGYILWLDTIKKIPAWELMAGSFCLGAVIVVFCIYIILKTNRDRIFHAFESIKLKQKYIDRALADTIYIEVTIPKNSQTTAFQIQQKILKALHSIYTDPIRGAHKFSPHFYFFQKVYRLWKVYRTHQVFFTLQIWAQYPFISFRLNVPKTYFHRIEKAIFNAYPNAEISMVDKAVILRDVATSQKSYLSYGQSAIEGKLYHRIKTFKDVSSDPVDSIISIMESLHKGKFMVYNITISPTSHLFNQIIHCWSHPTTIGPSS